MPVQAHGAPCWCELATTDIPAASAFYDGLLGWQAHTDHSSPAGAYTLFKLGDQVVAAGYSQPADERAKAPPHWNVYFAVDDVNAAAEAVRAQGGSVLMGPFAVGADGQMCICTDPEGVLFQLWQGTGTSGLDLTAGPGALCWVELASRNVPRAAAFYGAVLGWQLRADGNSAAPGYQVVQVQGLDRAGILPMDEQWGEMPAHWSVYFQVADCDAAAARAVALGGALCSPAFDATGVGRIAVLGDPQGAYFYVIRLEPG